MKNFIKTQTHYKKNRPPPRQGRNECAKFNPETFSSPVLEVKQQAISILIYLVNFKLIYIIFLVNEVIKSQLN